MKLRLLFCLLPAASVLAGCASTPRVRDLASSTGVYVQSLDSGTNDFVAAQNRLNASNQVRLQLLDQRSEGFRTETRQQRFAWIDAGDRQRLSSLDSVTTRTPEAIVADLRAKPLQSASVRATASEGYNATAEALAKVATKPKPLLVLGEFVQFAQAVNESYDKLKKAAEESTDAAADKAIGVDKITLATAAESTKPQ